MTIQSLVLRFRESLVSRLYAALREISQLKKELDRSRKQETVLVKMVMDTSRQGRDDIRLLEKELTESNRQRLIQAEQISELKGLASKDPLTGLLNRRGFKKALRRQVSTIQRYTRDNELPFNSPYMILLDLDKFKEVNDTYGHKKGDEVLLVVTEILNEVLHRSLTTDTVCRLGGDEFCVFFSSSTEEQSIARAELIRKKIEDDKRLHFPGYSVTASIGVTMVDIVQNTRPDEMDSLCEIAQELADQAMYHSKESGRNFISIATGNLLQKIT